MKAFCEKAHINNLGVAGETDYFSPKGGNFAADSPTATLLRLHPYH